MHKGVQGIAGDYRGMKGVCKGLHKGVQRIIWVYKGIQGITWDYRGIRM